MFIEPIQIAWAGSYCVETLALYMLYHPRLRIGNSFNYVFLYAWQMNVGQFSTTSRSKWNFLVKNFRFEMLYLPSIEMKTYCRWILVAVM